MTKFPPSVQEFEAYVLANAAYYTTIVFAAKKYHREEHVTLREAKMRARERTAQLTNGRKCMVYAVTSEGRSVMVHYD